MIVRINFEYRDQSYGELVIDLVDVWYKRNYWTTGCKILGVTTGPFDYNQGRREAVQWDGRGAQILRLQDFDYPPYHLDQAPVIGRAFYNVTDKIMRYGWHIWLHRAGDTTN